MTTATLKSSLQSKSVNNEKSANNTIFGLMDKFKDQIALALPRHMTADRMARIVTTEVRKTPELLKCNPVSLFGAVIQCSQLGLEPGNNLSHAYLLPFFNSKTKTHDVQLIIGYRGMLDLARRSGQIISISAFEVFDSDEFEITFGLNPNIIHKRDIKATNNDELIAVYAVAKLKDGGVQFEIMTKEQIDAIKKSSKAAKSEYSPWNTHYNEMAKKTVIRRLFKYLPVSIEIQQAVSLDENTDIGKSQDNHLLLYPDALDINNLQNEQEQQAEDNQEASSDINSANETFN